MALPIQTAPKYNCILPSDGKEVKYRPFLVKEQKMLLIAQEENDEAKIFEAVKDLIRSVTFEEIEPNELPLIDMEYLFLKIRARSVGETAKISIGCNDPECDGSGQKGSGEVVVNLDDVEVVGDEPENKIMINDEVGIELKYPKVKDIQGLNDLDQGSQTIEVLKRSIQSVFDSENVYLASEQTDKELHEFVENLTVQQLEDVTVFFNEIPRLEKEVVADCKLCGKEIKKNLIGLQNFF